MEEMGSTNVPAAPVNVHVTDGFVTMFVFELPVQTGEPTLTPPDHTVTVKARLVSLSAVRMLDHCKIQE